MPKSLEPLDLIFLVIIATLTGWLVIGRAPSRDGVMVAHAKAALDDQFRDDVRQALRDQFKCNGDPVCLSWDR